MQLVPVACCTILPLLLLLCTYKQVSLSTLQPTIRLLKTAIRSPLSVFLLLWLNKPSSSASPCTCVRKLSRHPMLVTLCWTRSSLSISFFYRRSQNRVWWSHECQIEGKRINLFQLLATLLLIQLGTWLVIFTSRAHS